MNIYILGAGGHAKAVYSLIEESLPESNILAFIDTVKISERERIFGKEILPPSHFEPFNNSNDAIVMGIGDNFRRAFEFNRYKKNGFKTFSLVHKDASVSVNSILDKGSVVFAGAIISTLVHIGENCIVNSGAIIEHESKIGSHSHVAPGSKIAGKVIIGKKVFIGMGSVIIDNVTIGDNAIIGAGSVITENVPGNAVVVGIPGKIIKYRDNTTIEKGRE